MSEIKRIYIEEGYEILEETTELMDGVMLHVYDGTDASITVGNHEIMFRYDDEAKRLFDRINDGVLAVELLAILARQ